MYLLIEEMSLRTLGMYGNETRVTNNNRTPHIIGWMHSTNGSNNGPSF